VQLWDARTGAAVGSLPGQATSIAWSPDGTRLATVGIGQVRIWDVPTGRPVVDLQGAVLTRKIAWSPDGRWLATAAEVTLRIWDARTGQPRGPRMEDHEAPVQAIAWAPDSTRLASSGEDATIRRWDAASSTALGPPAVLQDSAGAVGRTDAHAVAWSPAGTEIVTGDSGGMLRMWSADTGAPIGGPILTDTYVRSVAFSPDGRRLAAADVRGVRIWESVSERDACRMALNALGSEGLQAIAGASAPPLRCADPDAVPGYPWCRSAAGDSAAGGAVDELAQDLGLA
jgi:WD40 repeat protein